MELALAPSLAAQGPLATRPNRATQRSVPAFLNKLYSMVADQSTDDLIRWSQDGDSFFVPSADRFGKELLPRFFKHSNFGSFVRQLNMYGFHKVPHLQQGVLKRDQSDEADVLEFSNPHFMRGQPDLLCMIKRQKAGKGETAAAAAVAAAGLGGTPGSGLALDGSGRSSSTTAGGPNAAAASLNIATLLSDLAAIRKHQTAISADLKDLQARNHALWQEALQSREKHKKQEETINKILRFLAGVFGGQVLDAGHAGTQAQVVAGGDDDALSPSASSSSSPQASGVGASATVNGSGNGATGSGQGSGSGSGSRKADGPNGKRPGGGAVVVMPKTRLLLEDVKGRQRRRRAALRELDGEEEDDNDDGDGGGGRLKEEDDTEYASGCRRFGLGGEEEDKDEDVEIEEIPLLHAAEDEEDMPVISSALISAGSTALTRAPSHPAFLPTSLLSASSSPSGSRFTAIPSPVTDPGPAAPATTNMTQSKRKPSAAAAAYKKKKTNGGDDDDEKKDRNHENGSGTALIDPAQYNLPPEALKALLSAAGNNPQALQDFFRTTAGGSSSTGPGLSWPGASSSSLSLAGGATGSVAPTVSVGPPATSSALLPYTHAQPHYTSNPLDFAFSSPAVSSPPTVTGASPSFATSLAPTTSNSVMTAAALPSPVNFETAFAENNDVLSSVLSEKADLDHRTAQLENQISRLLDHLPDDAREQVENEAANGENSSWAGIDWANYTNDDGGVDFDKMLAQLSEISSHNEAPIDYSELLSNNALDSATLSGAASASTVSSAPTPSSVTTGTVDPALYGLGTEAQQPYEVTSPAETPTASGGPALAGTVGVGDDNEDLATSPASSINSFASSSAAAASTPTLTGTGRGKKRKSDAVAESPAAVLEDESVGTRRSTRRKRA
ncbi:hypothetical protein JCM3774_004210 [Rhodotorula dairenensis]